MRRLKELLRCLSFSVYPCIDLHSENAKKKEFQGSIQYSCIVEVLISGQARYAKKGVRNWSWPLTRMVLVCGH